MHAEYVSQWCEKVLSIAYLVQLNGHKSLPIWYNKYITDYNQKKKLEVTKTRKSEW